MILKKEELVRSWFAQCDSTEAKYNKIIELGRRLAPLPPHQQVAEKIVPGCQSIVYLHSHWDGEVVTFQAHSEALISSGLAYLLISVYSGERPEVILAHKPRYLEELGLVASLSPGRANGLASMYLRMNQIALAQVLERREKLEPFQNLYRQDKKGKDKDHEKEGPSADNPEGALEPLHIASRPDHEDGNHPI